MNDVATIPEAPRKAAAGRVLPARMLSHPLLLLLVGGAISALLVPMLTQRWQDHQRALDVRTALVADMTAASESYIARLAEVDFAARPLRPGAPRDAFRPSYKSAARAAENEVTRWNIRSAVIGSRLRAYYPDTSIQRSWQRLAQDLGWLGAASQIVYDGYRVASTRSMMNVLLSNAAHTELGDTVYEGFEIALSRVQQDRDTIVQQVLDTRPKV